MNKAENTHRWFAAWRAPRTVEDDPADMGTAFGLDLSLNLLPHEADAARKAAPKTNWVKRLALGRKAAL